MLETLLVIFVALIIFQILYYLGVFAQFSFAKPAETPLKRIPVSVIVCAKNEEELVRKNISLIIEQDYPDFEVILIDDASSDGTLEIFEEYEKNHAHVRVVKVQNIEAFWGNKKFALTLGIKAAKKEYLLFTDADCYPNSKNWIKEMSSRFTMKKTIVLGYGGYEKIPNSFLNKLIRLETLYTAVSYFSWAKVGKPYMGVGRNLAYKREEFFQVRGFMDHMKLRSGDDDLFINQAANSQNVTLCDNPDSFTYSAPKTSYRDWIRQKRRHATTAAHYKFFDQFQLTFFHFTQLLFLPLAILLLALQYHWMWVVSILAFRYLLVWIVMGFAAAKLKEKDTMYFFPIFELALWFTYLNIGIRNLFSTPNYWK